jgi:cysteinyl-tRNA synthetase
MNHNSEQLLKQEEEIKQRETEKRLEKERRQQEIQQKEEERRKKAMIDPMKMFKTEEYLEWDETGIPLKNSDGSQVAKSKRKKLEKQHQAQTKLYQEYKSSS